jgi:hypothetical protein
MFSENEFYLLRLLNCVPRFVHCLLAMVSGIVQIFELRLDLKAFACLITSYDLSIVL